MLTPFRSSEYNNDFSPNLRDVTYTKLTRFEEPMTHWVDLYKLNICYLLKEGRCFAQQKRVLPIHYLPESNPKNLPATNLSPLENCLYWFSEPNNYLKQFKTPSLIV